MNATAALILASLAGLVSWAAARELIRYAPRWKLVQLPNERSSHTVPTPRAGGVGIVLAASLAAVTLYLADQPIDAIALALALMVAALGLWDDLRSLPVYVRLAGQAFAVGLLLVHLGTLPPVEFVPSIVPAGLAGLALAGLIVVWWVNLFNFMDGIDGIASAQAIFMLAAGLALAAAGHSERLLAPTGVWIECLVAAVAGFALLNWPPARIFMGDVGSTYLGFTIAAVALETIRAGWLPYATWAILAAVFVTDATGTLVARIARRERLTQAHRGHVYQRLARQLGSHRAVTLLYLGINVTWLLPIAWASVQWPHHQAALLALAYFPLALVMALVRRTRAGAPIIDPNGSMTS